MYVYIYRYNSFDNFCDIYGGNLHGFVLGLQGNGLMLTQKQS